MDTAMDTAMVIIKMKRNNEFLFARLVCNKALLKKNWHVLYTKPRHEKKVAERLSEAGYTTYCPLYKVSRQWSDRTKVVE